MTVGQARGTNRVQVDVDIRGGRGWTSFMEERHGTATERHEADLSWRVNNVHSGYFKGENRVMKCKKTWGEGKDEESC